MRFVDNRKIKILTRGDHLNSYLSFNFTAASESKDSFMSGFHFGIKFLHNSVLIKLRERKKSQTSKSELHYVESSSSNVTD